jgi:type VI secretion system secreted protein Hcp
MADLSWPILLQHCAMGKTIPKAKFEFMRADANGTPVKYFEIELENVLVEAIHPGIEAGSEASQQMSVQFWFFDFCRQAPFVHRYLR